MDFNLRWGGDPEDLLITASGIATVEGIDASVEAALADPHWHPSMRVLVDHRLLDWSEMTIADVDEGSEMLARDAERIGHSFIAVATNSPLAFGLMRLGEAWLESQVPFELAVFGAIGAARLWLRQTGGETSGCSAAAAE